jgi:hypothetical protein
MGPGETIGSFTVEKRWAHLHLSGAMLGPFETNGSISYEPLSAGKWAHMRCLVYLHSFNYGPIQTI